MSDYNINAYMMHKRMAPIILWCNASQSFILKTAKAALYRKYEAASVSTMLRTIVFYCEYNTSGQ